MPVKSWKIIAVKEIPQDRTFRNAWEYKEKIIVNMKKAREIHKNSLRELRAPLFTELDISYQRADEAGNIELKKKVAEEKQTLRDVTDDLRITKAKTPEELKLAIPDILKRG